MEPTVEKFKSFLNIFWRDNDPETAELIWKRQLQSNADTAKNYLQVFAQILANPPDNLIEIMELEGWISLYHEETDTTFSREEYLDWLKEVYTKFRNLYNETTGETVA